STTTSSLTSPAWKLLISPPRSRRVAHPSLSSEHKSRASRAARGESGNAEKRTAAASPGTRTTLDRCQKPKQTCRCQHEQHDHEWSPGQLCDLRDLPRRMIPPLEHDEEKVAIVTGASQGIGSGLARAYRERGYAVIAAARSIEASEDPSVVTVEGDIADPDTAQRIVEAAVEHFGRIDTLINNAGIYIGKPF